MNSNYRGHYTNNRDQLPQESGRYTKNMKMDNSVYALRRKVMDVIYSLKKVADFDRVTVRIVETNRHGVLGAARLNDFIIWIPQNVCEMDPVELYNTVAHEVLHAVIGQKHVDGCPVMHAYVSYNPTVAEVNKIFMSYMK